MSLNFFLLTKLFIFFNFCYFYCINEINKKYFIIVLVSKILNIKLSFYLKI